jgi:undecaprenyl-diphosphatase
MDALLAWIAAHPGWAGAVLGGVAFTESLAIVGLAVPGAAVMVGMGTLIGAGHLPFWPLVAWAVAGAIAGDGLSYWLGRHYQQQLRKLWPLTHYPALLTQGEVFFARYGSLSIAFGRFVGPIRAVIPLVAGMLGMPPGTFWVANCLSALAWAPIYLSPGIVLGAGLQGEFNGWWLGGIVGAGVLLLVWLKRKPSGA